MRYAVMIECRAGTIRLTTGGWEDVFHTITWSVEDSQAAAQAAIREHGLYPHLNPREVRKVWVEERAE